MASHSPARIVLMFAGMLAFLCATIVKTLSSFGAKSGVFQQSTEEVILNYATPITPAPWALFIWDYTYLWIFAMFVYFIVGLCRRNVFTWMYASPAVIPYGFHISIIVNICLNITWTFLFDRGLLLAALIISGLMTLTDYMILFFSCQGLKVYGAWLSKHHNLDLWLIRVLVQNAVALYTTLGSLVTLLNLTVFLQHQTGAARCECAKLSLLLLLLILLAWFLLENFCLDEHVRYILFIYPVVIIWLTGMLSNWDTTDSEAFIFAASILAISSIFFVFRVALVTWRHYKHPLYKDCSMSPVEIALTQRKIFL